MQTVFDQWAKLNEANLNAALRCATLSMEAAELM